LKKKRRKEHIIRIRKMKVRNFNKQRGVTAYKWKIRTGEERQVTHSGKESYTDC
jgi:hypothetical protein